MSKIIEEKSSSNKSVWGQISNIDKGMFLITLMNVIILQFNFLFPEEIKSIIKSYYHFILENFSAIMIILIIFVLASLAIFCFVKYSNSNKEGGKDILDSDLRVISSSILFFLFFNLTLISCSTSFSMNIVKGETNRQEISQDVVKKIESSICPRNEIPDSTWVSTTGTNNNESSNYFLQCLLLKQYNKFLNNSKTENNSLKVYCYPNNAVRTVLIPDNKQAKDTLSHSVNNSIIICNSSSVFAKREGVCDTLHSEQNKKSIHNNFIKNNTISLVLLFIQVISLFMILFSVFLKNNKNDQGGDKKCDDVLIVSIFIASIAFSFVFPIAILATVGLYVFAKWFIHKKFDESLGFGVCFFPVVLIIIHGLTLYLIQGSSSYDYLISYDLSKISSKSLWEYIIPHITACVGWVTFWAFWAQLRANKIASIAAQKTSIENTFFKMIDIHRENLKEIRCSRGSSRHRVIINKEITGDTRQHIEEKLYYPNHDDFVEGKDAIKEICSLIFQCWENYKPNIKEKYDREKDRISKIKDFYIIYGDVFERSETNDVYKERYNENLLNDGNECHSALATYTFHLYRMVKYILRQIRWLICIFYVVR
ncbi:MAG: hypothetical protein N4A37_03235 [Prolixibacteraceae bacterium]|jgi:heme/copper-type cytochrome/quinol oxidase subunit 2|nr:hypothetical protein [Prolixibacteraceae bacterium]